MKKDRKVLVDLEGEGRVSISLAAIKKGAIVIFSAEEEKEGKKEKEEKKIINTKRKL